MPFEYTKEGNNYKYLSNGKWQLSVSNKFISVLNPVDNSLVGKIQDVS